MYQTNGSQNIVQVWAGSITNRDDALRLLLIVDYMSDWARDVYRTTVITELRVLANPDTDVSTIFADTDIFSSGRSQPDGVADHKARAFHYDPADTQAAFKALDSDVGVVRLTAWRESRFRALIITEDNVQRLTNSIREGFRAPFIRQILNQFYSPDADPVALTPQDLAHLEAAWTGHSRQLSPTASGAEGTMLYTAYVVLYYLLPSWDQVRELCVVSISTGALDILVADFLPEATGRAPTSQWSGANYLETGKLVLSTIEQLGGRVGSQENLLACIYRLCCRFRWAEPEPDMGGEYYKWRYRSCTATVWELTSYVGLVDIQDGAARALGNGLPSSFTSSRFELQPSSTSSSPRYLWPGRSLRVSPSGAILIHGDATASSEQTSPSLCVYVVRNTAEKLVAPTQDELGDMIQQALHQYHVYHTICFSGILDLWSLDPFRDTWNLKQPDGMFFLCGNNTFAQWLRKLGKPGPVWRNLPDETHFSIFSHNEFFWHDSTCRCGAQNIPISKSFLRQLHIAEATVWAWRAHKFTAHVGWTGRCALCCKPRGDGLLPTLDNKGGQVPAVCSSCWSYLSRDDSWETQAIKEGFQNAVLSKRPDIPERPHLVNKPCFSNPLRRLSRLIASRDGSRESRDPGAGENLVFDFGIHNHTAIPLDLEDIWAVLGRPDKLQPRSNELFALGIGAGPTNEPDITGMDFITELELAFKEEQGNRTGKRKRSLDSLK